MSCYCRNTFDTNLQSICCGCNCNFCSYRCCCCKTLGLRPVTKKRSRFGDIFKGQTPNLEELNSYKKKMGKGKGADGGKGGGKGGGGGGKGGGGGGNGGGKKGGKGGSKGGKGGGGKGEDGEDGGTSGGGKGGDGGGKGGGKGGEGGGKGGEGGGKGGEGGSKGGKGGGKDGTAAGSGEGGTGPGGQTVLGGGKGAAGGVAVGGVAGGPGGGPGGIGGSAGDGVGVAGVKWREDNECTPNQMVKCPHTCTLRPKKCMPNQIGPCNEACLKGTPYIDPGAGNQPPLSGGAYCTQGGIQGNYAQMQPVGYNQNWGNYPQTAPPQMQQTYCSGSRNSPGVPQTAPPQFCSPRTATDMTGYYPPQTQASMYCGNQNYGNVPQTAPAQFCSPQTGWQEATYCGNRNVPQTAPPQYCSPQMQRGYGNFNSQPTPGQYGMTPQAIYCQPRALEGYGNNPMSATYVTGYQQSYPQNYGLPPSTANPQMLARYLQGGDGVKVERLVTSCSAVGSIKCKKCGRERKFVQTLYVKPNVDTIFTTKDVKTKCSQTNA